MDRVAEVVVEDVAADTMLSCTVSASTIVPAADVKVPPLIAYAPPATEIGAGARRPRIVTGLDVAACSGSNPNKGTKPNGSGVVVESDRKLPSRVPNTCTGRT